MADDLYLINGSTLTNIGNAIRSVKGTSAAISVSNFASEISKFSNGGGSTTPTTPTYHTVTYKGFNSETLATYQVEHGKSCVYTGKTPVDSTGSYYFSGWDKTTTSVVSDMTVYAQKISSTVAASYFGYTTNDYNIKSYSGGSFAVIPQTYNGYLIHSIQRNVFTSNLTQLTIGCALNVSNAYLTYNSAFYSCNNLQDVYYCGTKSQWQTVITTTDKNASTDLSGNDNLFFAPRIHTTDGCIINQ